jgi:hypothetical protein
VEFGGDTAGVGWRGVEDGADSRGPLDREMTEKRKGKTYFRKHATDAWARWAGEDGFGLRGGGGGRRRASGAGWAKGRVGR